MLPFIGSDWHNSKKILLIGESHYLPFSQIRKYQNFDFCKNWYKGKSDDLNENHKNYLKTRDNVLKAESEIYEKPLAIYSNIRKAIQKAGIFKNTEPIFDKFSYYNYFQKPASIDENKKGNRSIKPLNEDYLAAYETLVKVLKIITPQTTIFVSTKSFEAFKKIKKQSKNKLENYKIEYVPHAGSQWWNRVAKKYGNRKGKEKFIELFRQAYS